MQLVGAALAAPTHANTVSARVVLIHSAVADSRIWERQEGKLRERGFDVVAPDLAGFGS
jgi:pimeloyl-ACP methyl ester carboxylesterase